MMREKDGHSVIIEGLGTYEVDVYYFVVRKGSGHVWNIRQGTEF